LIVPIFEYICRECHHHFETIVRGDRPAACPECQSQALDKQHSVFAVAAKSSSAAPAMGGGCGTCGDPRGPGSCSLN
jgi:putative FmdB family regulatory protein